MSIGHSGSEALALVVACSATKQAVPPPKLRLRSVMDRDLAERAAEWRRRLSVTPTPTVPAKALYAGSHWRWIREGHRRATEHFRVDLFIASAGYGLLSSDDDVKPYSATFACGSLDSVWRGPPHGDRRTYLHDWWQTLEGSARLREALTGQYQAVVFVLGANYVDALEEDLRYLHKSWADPDRFAVISAGSRDLNGLLPINASLRGRLGGTTISLNARAFAWLAASVETHAFRFLPMAAALKSLSPPLPANVRSQRRRITDGQLFLEIARIKRQKPGISRSNALRMLRKAGIACEQGRFHSAWAK
jgi:hypothetical protein